MNLTDKNLNELLSRSNDESEDVEGAYSREEEELPAFHQEDKVILTCSSQGGSLGVDSFKLTNTTVRNQVATPLCPYTIAKRSLQDTIVGLDDAIDDNFALFCLEMSQKTEN